MFNIPPSLPPTQYVSYPDSQTSAEALEEICAQNNISFETWNAAPDSFQKDIRFIAHRGANSNAPENTIPAYQEAALQGYKFVEADISWTKDGVPVLLHDKTINRTASFSNGFPLILPRYCSDMTYDELLQYDFGIKHGEQYEGTKIPTFEDFLKCCRDYDLSPYIELKDDRTVNNDKIKMLVDMVDNYGLTDKVTWISFNADYLKMLSEISPKARLGLLCDTTPSDKTLKILNSLKTSDNEVFLDAKVSKLTKNSVKLMKNNGFEVEVWTVDDLKYFQIAKDFGCSGITTDNLTNDSIDD